MICLALFAKIFRFERPPNHLYIGRRPDPQEGRCATSSTRVGMRWTRRVLETGALVRGRRSRVVLTPRRRRQVSGGNTTGDGDKKARSPGRARRKPLKPLRAGTPGESGCNRGDYARVLYFILHARLRVRWHPAFPTPFLGGCSCITRANLRRGNDFTRHHPRRRVIKYSTDADDGIERPRRTGYPACAGYDGCICSGDRANDLRRANARYLSPCGRGIGRQWRPSSKKNAEAKLRLYRIDRCDPGEGLQSIDGPGPLTPTLSHKGRGSPPPLPKHLGPHALDCFRG